MPSTTTSPVKILSDLGVEMVDIETDKDYLSALMEASAILQASGQTDQRFKILTDEVRVVRARRKKEEDPTYQTKEERPEVKDPLLRVKKTTITGKAFKKGSSVGRAENVAADTTGASALTIRDPSAPDVSPPSTDESSGESPSSVVSDSLKNSINAIAGSVDGIKQVLLKGQEEDKDAAADARRAAEESEQKKREKGLESKVFDGLKKTGEKILKPITSLWDRLLTFITTVFLGRIMVKFIDWLGNPGNVEKLMSFFRFLKDWWPVIVAGLLAFASPLLGPVGVIAGIIALTVWGVSKIWGVIDFVKNLPGKIWNFLTGGPKEGDPLKNQGPLGGMPNLKGGDNEDTQGKPSTEVGGETPVELAGGEQSQQEIAAIQEPQSVMEFNKGGQVPGAGEKDTVPAMLTPGEFVMTQEAVEKYGANTLEGMNAAASAGNMMDRQMDPQKVTVNAKDGKDGEDGGIQYKNIGGVVNRSRTQYYNKGGLVNNYFNPANSSVQYFNKGGIANSSVQYFNKGGMVKGVDPKTGEKKKKGGLVGKLIETVETMLQGTPEEGAKAGFMKGGPIGALIGGGLGVVGEVIRTAAGGGGGGAAIDISSNGKGVPDIQPPDTSEDVELAVDKAAAQAQKAQSAQPTPNDIPTFSAGQMISSPKIRTLGITV